MNQDIKKRIEQIEHDIMLNEIERMNLRVAVHQGYGSKNDYMKLLHECAGLFEQLKRIYEELSIYEAL